MTRHHQKTKIPYKSFKQYRIVTEEDLIVFKKLNKVLKKDKQFSEFLKPVDYKSGIYIIDCLISIKIRCKTKPLSKNSKTPYGSLYTGEKIN